IGRGIATAYATVFESCGAGKPRTILSKRLNVESCSFMLKPSVILQLFPLQTLSETSEFPYTLHSPSISRYGKRTRFCHSTQNIDDKANLSTVYNGQEHNLNKSPGYIKHMFPSRYQPYSTKGDKLRIFEYAKHEDRDVVLCESADWQLLNALKMQQVCKLKRLYESLTCSINQKQYQTKQQHQTITLKYKRNHNNKQQHQQHLQTAIVVRKYLNNDNCIPIARKNFEEATPMVGILL
uniref:Uncharacterized protein n=1 Tax=Glossina palpalis gambiensis TaxID=67801 RepID=A0A1B0AW37_9MUSC